MPALTIPSPTGGWNARDALENMAPTDAVDLVNWVPGNNVVTGRGGSVTVMDDLGASVDTLIPYEGDTATKLLAAIGTDIADVTGFTSPTTLATGFTSARWRYASFDNSMVLVNGINAAQVYNGTAISAMTVTALSTPVNAAFSLDSGTLATGTYYYRVSAYNSSGETLASTETSLAITGPAGVKVKWGAVTGATGYKVYGRSTGAELLMATLGNVLEWVDDGSVTPAGALPSANTTAPAANKISGVVNFKGRAFYWLLNSLDIWYAAAGSFQGALTRLPLGMFFQRGGRIVQVITWTRDSGDGVDDYCAFIASTGETLVYQGDDPGNALAWSMVGRFQMGAPLGVSAHCRFASTEIILTEDGFVGLDEAIQNARTMVSETFGGRIVNAAKSAAKRYRNSSFWSCIFYPRSNLFLANIPVSSTEFEQYVKNTNTGAWCRFNGWNARCFSIYGDRLYFGTSDGRIVLADVTADDAAQQKPYSDDGQAIQYECLTAYQKFGQPGLKTQLTAARVVMNLLDSRALSLNAFADYRTKPLPAVSDPFERVLGQWNVSDWDTDYWAAPDDDPANAQTRPVLRPITSYGFAIALNVRYRSIVQNPDWYSMTFVYKQAGVN
jgi:hypothetical protein